MKVHLVVKSTDEKTGIGNYAAHLLAGLRALGTQVAFVQPQPPLPGWALDAAQSVGYDLRAFFASYPVRLARNGHGTPDVTHLTTQSLGVLLRLRPQRPVVVTVHDILAYTLRDVPGQSHYNHPIERVSDVMALQALGRADKLLVDSEATRQEVYAHFGVSLQKMVVVQLGVDHARFRAQPVDRAAVRAQYGLPTDARVVLYVGSEAPRKNFLALLDAFAQVAADVPNAVLLKVGRAHFDAQRALAQQRIAQWGLEGRVHFTDFVTDDALVALYNAADVFAFPSLYEGFGLPVLEAMASGVPVVTSNTSSLPEVAGDAALSVDPRSTEAIAHALRRVLAEPGLAERLRARGLAQAARFTWEDTARRTHAVYEEVLRARATRSTPAEPMMR